MPTRRLGKRPAVRNPLIPRFSLLASKAAAPPDDVNWYAGVGDWPMALNDQLGCCVESAAAHLIQQRTAYVNRELVMPDECVKRMYYDWAGYDGTPDTDQGTIMSEALTKWLADGVVLPDGSRDKLLAFAQVNHASSLWMRQAIWRCGAVMLGMNLPQRWEEVDYLFDLKTGDLQNIAGGHCMLAVGYELTAAGIMIDVITWGFRGRMSLFALQQVADEAYAVLDNDWLDTHQLDPAGLNMAEAQQAMQLLRTG